MNYKPIFIMIVTDVKNERKMGSEETVILTLSNPTEGTFLNF